jgi:hypothetical protein
METVKTAMTDKEIVEKFKENKAKHYEATKAWVLNNKEKYRKSQHDYYLKNREAHNILCKNYQKRKYDEKKAEKLALKLLESQKVEPLGITESQKIEGNL